MDTASLAVDVGEQGVRALSWLTVGIGTTRRRAVPPPGPPPSPPLRRLFEPPGTDIRPCGRGRDALLRRLTTPSTVGDTPRTVCDTIAPTSTAALLPAPPAVPTAVRTAALICLLSGLVAAAVAPARAAPPTGLEVTAPDNGSGVDLDLSWTAPQPESGLRGYAVFRSDTAEGGYTLVADGLPLGTQQFTDKVTTDPMAAPPSERYFYRVSGIPTAVSPPDTTDAAAAAANQAAYAVRLLAADDIGPPVQGTPRASWVNTSTGHVLLLALIIAVGGMILWFTDRARKGAPIFIRRIPGIDAIEEGIGRATEMGKPVLYVPGIDELQDIQTIASMLILGQVSKMVAEYQAELIVSCCIPIVREVADEVVRAGFYQAGHPDAYIPRNTRFISSEQFAFCAGTNGIILREKPATNLYLGRFFAESLILAETGYQNRSIQIAGTAEASQLPFFVAACDYTLMGEELFAVSAYLSKDPRLVSSLKASDYVKVFCVLALVIGTIAATLGSTFVIDLFTISG